VLLLKNYYKAYNLKILKNEIDDRNIGLDLFRAVAVSIVVVGHFFEHFSDLHFTNFLPDGVEMFFVLSGFLIGNIFLNAEINSKNELLRFSKKFYIRRWLRTLPNYYLFLILNILFVYLGIYDGIINFNTSAYFVFLQNFSKPLDLFFWESWSLAVEEWFYLLLPAILVSVVVLFKNHFVKAYLYTVLILMIFPLLYRIFTYNSDADQVTYYLYFRKLVLTRLDSISYGLGAALVIKFYKESVYKSRFALFTLGVIGLMILKFYVIDWNSFFKQTVSLSFESLFTVMFLPMFYFAGIKQKILKAQIVFIAIISYSMYLVHLPLIYLIKKYCFGYNQIILLVIYLTSIIIVSGINYLIWERPTTKLRNRIL